MKPFNLTALLLFASGFISIRDDATQRPNKPAMAQKVPTPKETPATPDDLAIVETVVSELANDKGYREAILGNKGEKIVLCSEGFENFKPANDKIILSDLKEFSVELKRARNASNYMVEVDDAVWRYTFTQFFPYSKALLFASRPEYAENGTAVFTFSSGPEVHGFANCKYTLIKKQEHWRIIKREHIHWQ